MGKRLFAAYKIPIILILGWVCASQSRAAPWTQDVYLWQRQQSPEVVTALQSASPALDGVCVLAAEISWREGKLNVVRPVLDYDALKATGKPIGLALRIGAYTGRFAQNDETAGKLSTLAADLLAQALSRGLRLSELQIDFDCADAKLDGYRAWLLALRRVTGQTPLTFTVLPSWLKMPAFAPLVRVSDGFVLQVHSLEKPVGPDASFSLCDPMKAKAWVAQASRVGVPFRVALPTYGYRLAFDAQGNFFALSAEGPRPAWPADTQVRLVRTDAVAMAQLAQDLAREKPAGCSGVIWFRLPVAGDELNWDAVTFASVLHGEIPSSQLVLEVTWSSTGLADVHLVNHGQVSEPLPAIVSVSWADGILPKASDGLGGYTPALSPAGQREIVLKAAPANRELVLAPGRSRNVAWIRFPHEIPLALHFTPAP